VSRFTREAQACLYLPVLFDELNQAGVHDDQIELCFALGTHRELTHEEMKSIAGAAILKRVEFFQVEAMRKRNSDSLESQKREHRCGSTNACSRPIGLFRRAQ